MRSIFASEAATVGETTKLGEKTMATPLGAKEGAQFGPLGQLLMPDERSGGEFARFASSFYGSVA